VHLWGANRGAWKRLRADIAALEAPGLGHFIGC
jgi:hypothetical protein